MTLLYVTSNEGKFDEARRILAPLPLQRASIDLTEIQGNASEIIRHKAEQAKELLQLPVIVDDVSLHCPAIGGLPGPYIKEFLLRLTDRGLFELIHKYENHEVSVVCHIAFAAPGKETIVTEGTVHGKIVSPRGSLRHGPISWNPIVQPAGLLKTFGEMTMDEHTQHSMRACALKKLKPLLEGIV